MQPTRNNRGVAHETGSIEESHGHLKAALAQALLLRGTAYFDELADDPGLSTRSSAAQCKAPQAGRYRACRPATPPGRRTTDHEEALVIVSRNGGFLLRRVFYTVRSRLICHRLRVRLMTTGSNACSAAPSS